MNYKVTTRIYPKSLECIELLTLPARALANDSAKNLPDDSAENLLCYIISKYIRLPIKRNAEHDLWATWRSIYLRTEEFGITRLTKQAIELGQTLHRLARGAAFAIDINLKWVWWSALLTDSE